MYGSINKLFFLILPSLGFNPNSPFINNHKTLNNMFIQILWLLTWPILIAVSFYTINWMLKKFERNTRIVK